MLEFYKIRNVHDSTITGVGTFNKGYNGDYTVGEVTDAMTFKYVTSKTPETLRMILQQELLLNCQDLREMICKPISMFTETKSFQSMMKPIETEFITHIFLMQVTE